VESGLALELVSAGIVDVEVMASVPLPMMTSGADVVVVPAVVGLVVVSASIVGAVDETSVIDVVGTSDVVFGDSVVTRTFVVVSFSTSVVIG
jgi:hypothetical protein